jgi:hypothetical protein
MSLSRDHWEFIESLIELSENLPLREFLFTEGLQHGYKHGYAEAEKLRHAPKENQMQDLDESNRLSPSCVIMEYK